MGKTIGLMVYWFNGLMGFPLGKTKPFLESLVQRLWNTRGGDTLRPILLFMGHTFVMVWLSAYDCCRSPRWQTRMSNISVFYWGLVGIRGCKL